MDRQQITRLVLDRKARDEMADRIVAAVIAEESENLSAAARGVPRPPLAPFWSRV